MFNDNLVLPVAARRTAIPFNGGVAACGGSRRADTADSSSLLHCCTQENGQAMAAPPYHRLLP